MQNNYVGVIRNTDKMGRISLVKEYSDYLKIDYLDKLYIHKIGSEVHVSKNIINQDSLSDVRKVDKLGRVVVPIDIRNSMGLNGGTKYEQLLTTDRIIIKKFN